MEHKQVSDSGVLSRSLVRTDHNASRTVVWLSGEHDVSTAEAVSAALREAMSLDDHDLVVDLSEVRFLGAAIVGVFVDTNYSLRGQSRTLRLRRPSRCALRIIELCGLGALLDNRPFVARATGPAGALATWVPVPRSDRVDLPKRATGSDSNDSANALRVMVRALTAKIVPYGISLVTDR